MSGYFPAVFAAIKQEDFDKISGKLLTIFLDIFDSHVFMPSIKHF